MQGWALRRSSTTEHPGFWHACHVLQVAREAERQARRAAVEELQRRTAQLQQELTAAREVSKARQLSHLSSPCSPVS